MSETTTWPWAALFLLGAYHGINPGMGWLFAVALGMQEKTSRGVWRALGPITVGHALAIGVVVVLAGLVQVVLPLRSLKIAVAVILFVLPSVSPKTSHLNVLIELRAKLRRV